MYQSKFNLNQNKSKLYLPLDLKKFGIYVKCLFSSDTKSTFDNQSIKRNQSYHSLSIIETPKLHKTLCYDDIGLPFDQTVEHRSILLNEIYSNTPAKKFNFSKFFITILCGENVQKLKTTKPIDAAPPIETKDMAEVSKLLQIIQNDLTEVKEDLN